MIGPKTITIEHKGIDKTTFSGWGAVDMTKPFRTDYVRKDVADRSPQEHNRGFASIYELFETLPESLSKKPYAQSADALRKHGLIRCNYCYNDVLVFETLAQAMSQGPEVARRARRDHGYALVRVSGPCIHTIVPHSQSKAAMGHKAFHESITKVEDWIKCLLENPDTEGLE